MAGVAIKAGRTKARRMREAQDLAPDVPMPDILAFAERAGVCVLVFEHLGNDLSGVFYARGDDRLVFLNGSLHAVRLRFTLAHELSHHAFSDHAQRDALAGKAVAGNWIEVRANAFASELLMPAAAVERWVAERGLERGDLYDVAELAIAFGVSALAAYHRMLDAGVSFGGGHVLAAINEGRHLPIVGHAEPFADSLAEALAHLPRIPERFRSSVFFRVALGELSCAEGARRLGATEAQLRATLAPLGLLPPA